MPLSSWLLPYRTLWPCNVSLSGWKETKKVGEITVVPDNNDVDGSLLERAGPGDIVACSKFLYKRKSQ